MWVTRAVLTLAMVVSSQTTFDQDNICMLASILKDYTGTMTEQFSVSDVVQLLDGIRANYCSSAECEPELERDQIKGHNESVAGACESSVFTHDTDQCVSGEDLLFLKGYSSASSELTIAELNALAPSLLYQLIMTPCLHTESDDLDHNHAHEDEPQGGVRVWISGIVSVIVISLIGFAVIAAVPLIKRSLYDVLIQYLVALAVGTLIGDALLHLLPHALIEHNHDVAHSHEEENERAAVWKSLIAILGILLFFNAERIIGIFTMKKNRQGSGSEGKDPITCGSCNDVHIVLGHSSHEMKMMANKAHKKFRESHSVASKTPSGPVPDPVEDRQIHPIKRRPTDALIDRSELKKTDSQHSTKSKTHKKKHKKKSRSRSKFKEKAQANSEDEIDAPQNTTNNASTEDMRNKSKPELLVDSHAEEGGKHSHEVPDSFSAMAYMVVVGDGLHNFTDGMAIGVAFASSTSSGLSTSLAVLCHELPHEIGDFAILLQSGMTVRQAFLSNLLSAVLQLVGALVGAGLGVNSTQWLFALSAGIFLYVGLVDMVPEITKVQKNNPWRQLLLQDIGMCTGIAFMLLIALFESDIENLFVTDDH